MSIYGVQITHYEEIYQMRGVRKAIFETDVLLNNTNLLCGDKKLLGRQGNGVEVKLIFYQSIPW